MVPFTLHFSVAVTVHSVTSSQYRVECHLHIKIEINKSIKGFYGTFRQKLCSLRAWQSAQAFVSSLFVLFDITNVNVLNSHKSRSRKALSGQDKSLLSKARLWIQSICPQI